MTSRPWAVTPSANARASSGELSRMSWPMATVVSPSSLTRRANAAPVTLMKSASRSTPMTPRTSYALMTAFTDSRVRIQPHQIERAIGSGNTTPPSHCHRHRLSTPTVSPAHRPTGRCGSRDGRRRPPQGWGGRHAARPDCWRLGVLRVGNDVEVTTSVRPVFRTLGGAVDGMVLPHHLLGADQAAGIAAGLTDGLSQGREILIILREDVIDAQHLPAERRGDALGVVLTQNPAVRPGGRGGRTQPGR